MWKNRDGERMNISWDQSEGEELSFAVYLFVLFIFHFSFLLSYTKRTVKTVGPK